MFEPLPSKFDFPKSEEAVLKFWKEHDIFGKSLEQRKGAERFVFYEGPPTANGMPHPGHCLTRAMKDLFPRYQTMCGKLVERKAGWDTHGLPVEVEVCKELGIHTKEEIEAYGVEHFVRKCVESVWRYTREWEDMTNRLGFWINLDDAYATYHQYYVESVWWSLKTLFDRGLLYQGHKVVWWWAQGGTALSAGEVGEGYREVVDPSVYVRFPLVEGQELPGVVAPASRRCSLLVWTTTPWTLISNHFAAVHPELDYALVRDTETNEYFYIAAALVESISRKVKHELEWLATIKGTDLVGLRYVPPFRWYYDRVPPSEMSAFELGSKTYPSPKHRPWGEVTAQLRNQTVEKHVGWRVLPADFVTLDSGTGLVHQAPAFGEVDFDLLQRERRRFASGERSIPLICAVAPNGEFNDDAPEKYSGRWVKDCDKDIIRELKERGLLYHQEQIRHDYPFCPRAEDDPLIQYARKSWFVRTRQFKDEFLRNNDAVTWLPEHIKEGRFGDFLRNNVDWAISRERYWGTPLPIWVCEQTGKMEAIGSFDELTSKPGATDDGFWERMKAEHPEVPDDLRVHKPYIDEWTYESPFVEEATERRSDGATKARMRRVSEVIDCWWDAGSMPFAQWGFPHADGSAAKFEQHFPADFISEAIDQTRGWFYGLLAISTMMFDKVEYPRPYRACLVLGHMMGEDGLKMSKRTKNYKEPSYVFDRFGADAMRWYFFSAQAPWTNTRFEEDNIRDAQREFLVRLYNVFSFFTIYANIDGFEARHDAEEPRASARAAATGFRPVPQRSELDRWIISELHRTIRSMRASLDRFENYPAACELNEFVDGLSNWYVRRSRDRFWRAIDGSASVSPANQDKWDAYNTLYEVLLSLSKMMAPFTPFFAETMYRNLKGTEGPSDQGTQGAPISVHLCDYPAADASLIDERLAAEMEIVRELVSLGRSARTAAKLKVRQPLGLVEVILAHREHESWLRSHAALIAEELNVKSVEFATEADHYVSYQLTANFQSIGPKFGKLAPKIAKALGEIDAAAARSILSASQKLSLEVDGQQVELDALDVQIRLEAKPGWSAAQGRSGVVVVKTELTDELIEEGMIRELIHHVQGLRKEHELAYQARITLYVSGPDELASVVRKHVETVQGECLAERVLFEAGAEVNMRDFKIENHDVKLGLATHA